MCGPRPIGRPPKTPPVFFASYRCRVQSWTRSRRVIAKVECTGGSYPRVGFMVTNRKRLAEQISPTSCAPLP